MRKSLSFFGGIVLALAALELTMQLLPVQTALRIQPTGPAQPFIRYRPEQTFTYSHGWAFGNARRGVINRDGFNNSAPLRENQPVLIVGDSYIEAYMLPYAQTVQGRLDAVLGGGVAAAAASGNGLADSLQVLRNLVPRYHPQQVVLFVDAGNVRDMLAAPGRGHNAFSVQNGVVSLMHNPYQESSTKQVASRSALLRYMYYNLKLSDYVAGQVAARRGAPEAKRTMTEDGRRVALAYYLDQLRQIEKSSGCRILFLVDGDRKRIYADAPQDIDWGIADRRDFLTAVREAGFPAADMHAAFVQHWRATHEHVDFMPADGHWNAVGHHLAAQEVLALLDIAQADLRR